MIKRYNNISFALGIPGIILQIVGMVIEHANQETGVGLLGGHVYLVGTALLIAGLGYYAIAKGRSGWWGLCGFLSLIGLIILALLKDHTPDDATGKLVRHGHQTEGRTVSDFTSRSVSRLRTRFSLAKRGLVVGSIGLIIAVASDANGIALLTIVGGLMAFYGFIEAGVFLFTGRSDAPPGWNVQSYHCPHCHGKIERGSLTDAGESMSCPHCFKVIRT